MGRQTRQRSSAFVPQVAPPYSGFGRKKPFFECIASDQKPEGLHGGTCSSLMWMTDYFVLIRASHIATPGPNSEPECRRPASGLAEAERKAALMLAARSPLEPPGDI